MFLFKAKKKKTQKMKNKTLTQKQNAKEASPEIIYINKQDLGICPNMLSWKMDRAN